MRKILFHHVPKTAGTSLIAQLSAFFRAGVHGGRYDDQLDESAILDDRYTFYHGHFTHALVANFRRLVPNAMIFTFVRHPFTRTLSQYYNWTDRVRVRRELSVIEAASDQHQRIHRLRRKFEEKIFDMNLEAFLRSQDCDVLQGSDNVQAQMLSSAETSHAHARYGNAAIDAVAFYDFIGVQEHYASCLRILEGRCALPPNSLDGIRRDNTSDYARQSDRYRVTMTEMRLLERRNIYDLALYNTCYALLLKQYGEWLPSDATDLTRYAQLPLVAPP